MCREYQSFLGFPSKTRFFIAGLTVLQLSFLVCLTPAYADRAASALLLQPEEALSIKVEQLDNFKNFQLLQTNGTTLLLPNVDRFEVADFNFDGHDDLRIVRLSGHNTIDDIYLYNSEQQLYSRLVLPQELSDAMICKELMNVQIIKADVRTPPLLSINCAVGRSQNVNYDYLSFNAQGAPTLFQQYIYSPLEVNATLMPYTDLPWGITYQVKRDFSSNTTSSPLARVSQAFEPIVFKVMQNQLTLSNTPKVGATSIYKLSKGELCMLIDLQEDWLQLSCQGADGKVYLGWFNWQNVIKSASPKSRPFILTEQSSAKRY